MATQNVIQFMDRRDELTSVRKIVVAYDFSAAADRALADAVTLAKRFNAEIVVAHVEVAEAGVLHMPSRGQTMDIRDRLETIAARIQQGGVNCRPELRSGAVVSALVCIAGEEDADLVLAGASGNSGSEHKGLGSTAQRLLRMDRPVILYSPTATAPGFQEAGTEILMPIEFLCDPYCVRLAANASRLFDAHLDILHVVDVRSLPSMPNAAQDMQYNCDKLAARLRSEGIKVSDALLFGKPEEQILERSRTKRISMILMPLASRAREISDNVAAGVIHGATVPVLTCRIDEYPEWRYGYADHIAS
jgi:nucleotide-binding universal stress UspA family protein